jgi:hypothetical protein
MRAQLPSQGMSDKQYAIFTSEPQSALLLKVEFSKTCTLMCWHNYKFGSNVVLFIFNIQNANINYL